MTCPHRDMHLQSGLPAEEEAALVVHARSCAECTNRRALLDRSRAVLQADLPALDQITKARWLATAKAQRGRQRPWALPVAVSVALAAAVFAFISVQTPGPTIEPAIAVAELRPNEMVETKTARWVALSDFRLTRLPSVETEIMRIDAGHLEIEMLDPAKTAIIQTHAGSIELEGGQYELRIDTDGAVIRINEGQAILRREDNTMRFKADRSIRLNAGQWPPEVQVHIPTITKVARTAPPVVAMKQVQPAIAAETEAVAARRTETTSPRQHKRLTEARALLGQDNKKAVALAEAVISDNPNTAPIEASMIAADGYRRRGEAEKAEQLYRRVAAHPDGALFADEALTRRAVSLAERGLDAEALVSLKQAHLRFDGQGLAPERAALEARIHLRAKRSDEAAEVLLRLSDRRDRVLDSPRIETARALQHADPRRATLLGSVIQGGGPRADRARDLLTSEKKNDAQ